MKPVVSVICITYNQESFLRKTLDSFLMQKTDFAIEVLIHDDASTDGTAEIIKEYTRKFPRIIKPILETENQYSKGTFQFVNDMFSAAKGKYIAVCEGDDYWTDPYKLQKQVDYLEKNREYAICFHAVNISYEDGSEEDCVSPDPRGRKSFTVENLLKDNFIYTCSVMYRARSYESLVNSVLPQDLYLHLFHAQDGKIGFIKEVMAVYRKQASGVWWDSGARMNNIYRKYRFQLTNLFAELLVMFHDNKKYTAIINKHLDYLLSSFIDIDTQDKTTFFADTAKDFPHLVARFASNQKQFIDELRTENRRLAKDIGELLPAAQELAEIKGSRWHKLKPTNPAKRPK